MAKRSGISASRFLMPMSFGALLGGLMTQIGTSPNIIVSRVRGEMTGEPFSMFDFTAVGATLAAIGVLFLIGAYRLLPERTRATVTLDEALAAKSYVTEAEVTEASPMAGKTVSELQALGDGEAKVTAILQSDDRRTTPLPDAVLKAGDTVILEGNPHALERVVSLGKLQLESGHRTPQASDPQAEIRSIEAVIGANSPLIGMSAQSTLLFGRFGINLLAVSRTGHRLTERLGTISLQVGDVVVLQGSLKDLAEHLRALECLPLAERELQLGNPRRALAPLIILAGAMALTALEVLPVAIAFFAAARLPAYGALALILAAAMAVTPFLNNAATVLVMAPIAVSFSTALGYRPDAFLMAVAIGAGCDFLTPIGHQCNTLVMGLGGYRFGDYARLGAPLSLLVILIAVPMLLLVWPVR
jgi:di/tricarboxylate transporter